MIELNKQEIEIQLRIQVRNQVWSHQAWNHQAWSQVSNQVWEQVNPVRNQVRLYHVLDTILDHIKYPM